MYFDMEKQAICTNRSLKMCLFYDDRNDQSKSIILLEKKLFLNIAVSKIVVQPLTPLDIMGAQLRLPHDGDVRG